MNLQSCNEGTFRTLDGEKVIGWTAPKDQFGGGVNLMRNFKPLFSENVQLALSVYRTANVMMIQRQPLLLAS